MKKSIYNMLFGILNQFITIAMGILVPRLVLLSFGSEVNGLLSSVGQLFTYLTLLEAGVGGITIQALYGPVAKNDKNSINKILSATNRFYKKTGIIYFLAVLLLALIYPFFVKTTIEYSTIVFIIVFIGMGGVINYFFQGKYRLLLQAEGKNYILTNLATVVNIVTNVSKIGLMLAGYDVVTIHFTYMIINILQMLYITYYMRKHYVWINLKVEPDFKAIEQKKSVLIHQIAGMVFNNTDMLILTVFCGLKTVSVYSMYALLLGMISTFTNTCLTSITFILGQTFNIDKKKFIQLQDWYETYVLALVFALYSVVLIFISPFLQLYTSGITDITYIDKYLPFLFVITYILSNGRNTSLQVINFAKHYKETKTRALIETIINLSVSIIAVNKLGIYGVLIGTITALLYRNIDMIFYSNNVILHRSTRVTLKKWGYNLFVFCIFLYVNSKIIIHINSYIKLFLIAAPIGIFTLIIYFGVASLIDKEEFRFTHKILKRYLKRKK